MKSLLVLIALSIGLTTGLQAGPVPSPATSYTGHVDGMKTLSGGAIVFDLDGKYPNAKMSLFVPGSMAAQFSPMPKVGDTVTAFASVTSYQGRPEMKINSPSELKIVSGTTATP